MTAKQQRTFLWALFSPMIACGGILILLFVFLVSPTHPFIRNKMAEYYRNSEYLTIFGTIDDYYSYPNDRGASIYLKLDEECINSLNEEQLRSFTENGLGLTYVSYELVPKCKEVLIENGFFDLLKTDGNGKLYSEETVTLIVNNKTRHHDDMPYAIELSVGDTVYLDFETGKELLIDYILHDMY